MWTIRQNNAVFRHTKLICFSVNSILVYTPRRLWVVPLALTDLCLFIIGDWYIIWKFYYTCTATRSCPRSYRQPYRHSIYLLTWWLIAHGKRKTKCTVQQVFHICPTAKKTSVPLMTSPTLLIRSVIVCLRHNHTYARNLHQSLFI